MGFTLEEIVPWGRSCEEYLAMFGLTAAELQGRILGCGDGPAAFNAEVTRQGGRVVSVDPLYRFSAPRIRERIAATYDAVLAQVRANQGDYVWTTIASVEELGRIRLAAMETFLADYEGGRPAGRYLAGELPSLPVAAGSFDLALSSHLLFLYSDHLAADFHVAAILEMLRVAREVRVFPLLTLAGAPSPHLPRVQRAMAQRGFRPEVRRVAYEFQRGGDEMLVIRRGGGGTTPRSRCGPAARPARGRGGG